jgi:hypothetical protein
MSKVKMTISISEDLADYLRDTASVSSTIAEAVEAYRARALERELEEAYLADAAEAEQLNEIWKSVDPESADD